MELPDRSQARSWEGKDVVDRDGQHLGRCVGVFADTATGVPEWLHVDVEGHVRSFVPALEAAESDGTVRVRFAREAVLSAPGVGDDEQLSKAEEIELYRHYDVPVESDEGSVLPASDATVDTGTTATTPAPVVGTSEPTSTAVAGSGADTSVAEGDAEHRAPADTGETAALPVAGTVDGDGDRDGTSALADVGTVSSGPATPATGEELPVLDPAAASVPVPEEQVTYVDEPEQGRDETPEPAAAPTAPAAPAAEQPRPVLRRVPPASPPPATPAPAPAPAPSSAGSGTSSLAPLGAAAGVAAAVAVVLKARERRSQRRNSPTARVARFGDTLRAGSAAATASAKVSAGNTLAGVSEAAELTRRSAATAAAQAAKAARHQAKAAAKSRRQQSNTSSALAAASKTASAQKKAAARRAAEQRKAATASIAAASKAAAQQRAAAKASLAAATSEAGKQGRAVRASVAATSSRSGSTTKTVTTVPRKVAKRGRKVRRSVARTIWNAVVLSAAGGGYVLGAKAGRQRYDELAQVAAAVAESPKVQSATEAVTDPERRADLLVEVQQQASSLVGRRGEPRS